MKCPADKMLLQGFWGLALSKKSKWNFLEGKDMFVVLPMGLGKSACYQCPPALFEPDSLLVVISPLIALIKDQVSLYQ